ncbi:uncharacterized protein CDV56_101196 [Aspergillus thermomutatus]|uniref:Uncharacterized protein n=1 Tax=Aspergillus thermomutatus TaxID=41047 RepID=A0A397HP08_ASPTH|nr:uncharacterized protein CDV56_101196 [Aspergillus thermomutatus]RHZ64899.1 hypothetical protein CDV56_101196 [Aspergillus thermomutatus]
MAAFRATPKKHRSSFSFTAVDFRNEDTPRNATARDLSCAPDLADGTGQAAQTPLQCRSHTRRHSQDWSAGRLPDPPLELVTNPKELIPRLLSGNGVCLVGRRIRKQGALHKSGK